MVVVVELEQPFASVPVTVYVWVDDGVAVTAAPVVDDKVVAGLHVYVVAPLAVSITLVFPGQTFAVAGVTETLGSE